MLMILADQLLPRVFADGAKLIVYISDNAVDIGQRHDGVLILIAELLVGQFPVGGFQLGVRSATLRSSSSLSFLIFCSSFFLCVMSRNAITAPRATLSLFLSGLALESIQTPSASSALRKNISAEHTSPCVARRERILFWRERGHRVGQENSVMFIPFPAGHVRCTQTNNSVRRRVPDDELSVLIGDHQPLRHAVQH